MGVGRARFGLRDGFMKCLLAAKANGPPADEVWREFSKVFEKYARLGSNEALIADDESEELGEIVSGQNFEIFPEEEELIEKFLEIMKQEGRVSTSLFQRRLRLGYTRAARIVDIMERRGIIGPMDGANDRRILVNLDEIS